MEEFPHQLLRNQQFQWEDFNDNFAVILKSLRQDEDPLVIASSSGIDESTQSQILIEYNIIRSEIDERIDQSISSKLSIISAKVRAAINKDVPRTFDAFDTSMKRDQFETKLSRMLLISSCMTGGEYCQGWNFVAGSFCADSKAEESLQFLRFFVILRYRGIISLYQKNAALQLYLQEFTHQLAITSSTRAANDHMRNKDFGPGFYANEWFITCFTTWLPPETINCIQDMIIAGISNALLRVGIAIIEILSDDIVACSDFEELHQLFKKNKVLSSRHLKQETRLTTPIIMQKAVQAKIVASRLYLREDILMGLLPEIDGRPNEIFHPTKELDINMKEAKERCLIETRARNRVCCVS